ncbi:MAG: CRISPR-associated endonuclease Cas1 [Acidimicrobiia bacterium]
MAANPANAILNYMYALLEAETTIGCHTVGLDPGIGILHADQHSRDSFALDLMEASRPYVDRWLLDLLEGHYFRARDFSEDRRGSCRINPPLTHHLSELTSALASQFGPVIERASQLLADTPGVRTGRIPTPLTGSNRATAREAKASSGGPKRTRRVQSPCPNCGGPKVGERSTCDGCFPEWKAESLRQITEASQARLAYLRGRGEDPAHGGEAAARRGSAVSDGQRASRLWDEQNEKPLPSTFEPIQAALEPVTVSDLARCTGVGGILLNDQAGAQDTASQALGDHHRDHRPGQSMTPLTTSVTLADVDLSSAQPRFAQHIVGPPS